MKNLLFILSAAVLLCFCSCEGQLDNPSGDQTENPSEENNNDGGNGEIGGDDNGNDGNGGTGDETVGGNDDEPEAEAVDLSADGSANSYIVSAEGSYKFLAVKGNSSESVGATEKVEVLWETFGTGIAPKVGDLVSEVSFSDGYISFKASGKKGNASIAAKDGSGTILWSWHIWMTDQPEDQVYNNDAGTMMDRNLGATSATPGDIGAFGLMYQWGRKDPFLGAYLISTEVDIYAFSTIIWPFAVESNSSNGTIDYATEHPTTFIYYNRTNYDWYYTGDKTTDNARWQSSKTIYDPCPSGYRIPDGGEDGIWAAAFGSSSSFDQDAFDAANNGFDFGSIVSTNTLTSSSETCWYPAPGCLSNYNGYFTNVGNSGRYWSCTPNNGSYAYYLFFSNNGSVNPSNYSSRAVGSSVRCQKME